jgi:hypothetical protein
VDGLGVEFSPGAKTSKSEANRWHVWKEVGEVSCRDTVKKS